MMQLLIAVFFASILGSVHCVGMCGPFVLLATGRSESCRAGSMQRTIRMSCYHVGRLTTYLILGVAMGAIGAATDGLAGNLGYANVAARVVGAVMIVLGVSRLMHWLLASKSNVQHSVLWARWNQLVASVRKRLPMQSPYSAAYSWGLVSTWLPCGWLAIFAIAAAGAGGIPQSMALMAAFWVGTLPLLSLVAFGATILGPAVHRWIQPAAACVLIAFGIYTATSRASIDLGSIQGVAIKDRSELTEQSMNVEPAISVDALKVLTSQELPCCEANDAVGSKVADQDPDGN